MAEFRNYKEENYEEVCSFLIELNRNKEYINWNWARFEWMYEHPEFDKASMNDFGLWWDGGKIVGAAIYDMYFGEAFCGVLPEYAPLYKEVLNYAYDKLKDENGLGIAIADGDAEKIKIAESLGFKKADQTENILRLQLKEEYACNLAENLQIAEFDVRCDTKEFSWLLWQGFDHGTDKTEFEENIQTSEDLCRRPHFNPKLSIAVQNERGEKVSYCCLWYNEKTDYAYIEPVCTVPAYRGKGAAKAALYHALNQAKKMGAKSAFVISDMDFYKKLGFEQDRHYTFYWKEI